MPKGVFLFPSAAKRTEGANRVFEKVPKCRGGGPTQSGAHLSIADMDATALPKVRRRAVRHVYPDPGYWCVPTPALVITKPDRAVRPIVDDAVLDPRVRG